MKLTAPDKFIPPGLTDKTIARIWLSLRRQKRKNEEEAELYRLATIRLRYSAAQIAVIVSAGCGQFNTNSDDPLYSVRIPGEQA